MSQRNIPNVIFTSLLYRVSILTACLWSEIMCFSGHVTCDLNLAPCFLPKLRPQCQKASEPRTAASSPSYFHWLCLLQILHSDISDSDGLLKRTISSHHRSTRQKRLQGLRPMVALCPNNEGSYGAEKTWSLVTGSCHPPQSTVCLCWLWFPWIQC